jgi:hypothetical protein
MPPRHVALHNLKDEQAYCRLVPAGSSVPAFGGLSLGGRRRITMLSGIGAGVEMHEALAGPK